MSEKVTSGVDVAAIDTMIETARKAAAEFENFNLEQVNKIVAAVAAAGYEKSAYYAEWAVRETGFGVAEHKTLKNQYASGGFAEYHKGKDFTGYELDREKRIIKFARPAGVVLSLIPCTNPIASTYFSIIIAMMTRNAVVMCPHPAAKDCSVDAAEFVAKAAFEAGAPAGSIQVVRNPSIPLLGEMMKHDKVNLILATGGAGVVRAAYSSGNPALGVGPGNVPHYIDETFDLKRAAEDAIFGGCFDNNLPCTCTSVILAEATVADELRANMAAGGTSFITDPAAVEKLRQFLFPEGQYNPEAIGQPAKWIADQVGIEVHENSPLLCVDIEKIDYKQEEFSREKLFPVIGFMRVNGFDQAYAVAEKMIRMGGMGHSAVIHSNDPKKVVKWGSLPVYRISVDGPGISIAGGLGSGLPPTFTLGTGFFGRSSVAENVGPEHLVHWTSIAYSLDEAVNMGDIDGALQWWEESRSMPA